MAVTNFSPLLGLALPTTGDLNGTWGTVANDSITQLIDSAVAGTATLSTDVDVTLSTTNGATNQARNAVLLCTGSRASQKTITAPAQSKAYVVINATTGGFGVKVVGAGPTTGVVINNGEKALIAWNGSDFVIVSSSIIDLTTEVTGTLPVANGGTGVTTSTGSGSVVLSNSPTLVSPALGTPSSATLTNATGLPISTGVSGLGTGVATFLATPSSANLAAAVIDETGTGALVFSTSPTLVTPALGTPSSATLTNATGLPIVAGTTGTLSVARGGTAATTESGARTNLGATTLGSNLFTITNPSAVTFPRFNADNTVSSLNAADFRTAIGAGTGGGSVTSVALSGGTTGLTVSGSPITTSGTITLAGTLAIANGGTGATTQQAALNALSGTQTANRVLRSNGTNVTFSQVALATDVSGTLPVANGGTGATSLTANNVILGNGTSAVQFVAPGSSGNVLTSNGTTWTSAAAGASLSGVTDSASPFETALGVNAGAVNTGTYNTFLGYGAFSSNTSGNFSVGVGALTGVAITTGTYAVAVGYGALNTGSTHNHNVGIGGFSVGANGSLSGDDNTGVGSYVLTSLSSGHSNTAIGKNAGFDVTTGTQNVIIGYNAANSGTNDLTTGSNNIIIGFNAAASSATVSNEVTIGNTNITSTRLRGMVELNAAMFEKATISATAATGTINFDARTQSVLYYTTNASGNWTLNIRAASGVSLDSVMTTGESMTVAFLVTNGATAYYQTGFTIDGTSVTPKWQGGTAPTAGNASSIDTYVITVIKTGAATFTVLASQTKFA